MWAAAAADSASSRARSAWRARHLASASAGTRPDFVGPLRGLIERQAALAIDEAHLVLLVVDGQTGPTAADEALVRWLRRAHPRLPLLLAVNKVTHLYPSFFTQYTVVKYIRVIYMQSSNLTIRPPD